MSDLEIHAVLLIPAFNEEASLPGLLHEIRDMYPELPIVVINDASTDSTSEVARAADVTVLDLPINLGVAGAMQTGFRWAFEHGFAYAIRCDSDGQHPPSAIPTLVQHMASHDVDLVIGSRFLGGTVLSSNLIRRIGIGYLGIFLSLVCRNKVTDPTSGFQVVNRYLMYYFSNEYPEDYPEPESLALLRRQGYTFSEVGVPFRERTGGTSSLNGVRSLYFALKVTLALMVDRARGVDESYARHELENRLI